MTIKYTIKDIKKIIILNKRNFLRTFKNNIINKKYKDIKQYKL